MVYAKRKLLYINTMSRVITLVLVSVFALSCAKEEPFKRDPDPSHLKYFGFTLIDTYWDDPSDDVTKANYIDEVASFSNVADILVIGPLDSIVERMQRMNRVQVKCILHLNELFFEQTGTESSSRTEYKLRADYKNRWDDFVQVNALHANQNLIQAFYMGEEPTWNGISYHELKSATDYVDQQFSDIPIMVIEAYPILDKLQVPESVDWIGFDHYFVRDPFTDPDYQREWNTLKLKLSSPHQRIVVVMDSHYIPEVHGEWAGIDLDEMGEVAQNYYRLAKSDSSVVALLGYFWPNGFDFPESIGARGMPQEVREAYVKMGKEISGK